MANSEDAIQGLADILTESFPKYLREVELQYTDGVELEQLRDIVWEDAEAGDNGIDIPGAMLLATSEVDVSMRDLLYDCNITGVFVFQDSVKRNVTKKMFRYAKALRRMLRPANNRSLLGKVNSIKVADIRWLPVLKGNLGASSGLFARGFEADMVVRMPKEGD